MVWHTKIQTWRTVEFYYKCHGLQFRRQRTSRLQSFQCVDSGIHEKERWVMHDSLQCGSFECRTFFFARSILQISSISRLVWWIDSADSWSIIFKHGEICCESGWPAKSKIGAWRGEYVASNTWNRCSCSEGSTAWTPRDIRTFFKRDKR